MTKKVALITGITGQDGSLLARYLLEKNYQIIAPTRKNPNRLNLEKLGVNQHSNLKFVTYKNKNKFKKIIKKHQPGEIYHLAAMTHVGDSHLHPESIFEVNTVWTVKILSYIQEFSAHSKLFFASSSEVFGKDTNEFIDETSLKAANTPYGISKMAAHQMVEYYRNVKGLFACNGILFNHESELRPDNFVSMKIFKSVARIVKNGGEALELGNIEAKKDWGYAPDFVPAYYQALQQNQAEDYVLATGSLCSVKQLVNSAFSALDFPIQWHGQGMDAKAIDSQGNVVVQINPKFFRPLDNKNIVGNSFKAQQKLDWTELTPFSQWVTQLTINEYRKISK
jgi:GDPmannose 4,6-dehydratase